MSTALADPLASVRSYLAGEDPLKVMKQSRHLKVDTLKGYDRRDNSFEDHAGAEFL